MTRALTSVPPQRRSSAPKPAFQTFMHGAGSYDGEASFREGGVEYRDAGKTECFEGECSLTLEDSDPTFWGEAKLN